jgi:hypothetical protein
MGEKQNGLIFVILIALCAVGVFCGKRLVKDIKQRVEQGIARFGLAIVRRPFVVLLVASLTIAAMVGIGFGTGVGINLDVDAFVVRGTAVNQRHRGTSSLSRIKLVTSFPCVPIQSRVVVLFVVRGTTVSEWRGPMVLSFCV